MASACPASGGNFHADKTHRPEKLGYVIEGAVEESDGPAEVPMAEALTEPAADCAQVKGLFKCVTCHTIDAGGANGIGPNLYGVMGGPSPARPGSPIARN